MATSSSSIALYRERTATDVINATFRFLRAHFGPLAKALLLLAGPALLLANIASAFSADPQATATGGIRPGFFLVQMAFTLLGSVIAMGVTIGAIQITYVDGPAALTTRRLWKAVRTHGVALFGRQVQIGLIIGGGSLFTAVAAGGTIGVLSASGSTALAVVVGGLLLLLFLGFLFYAAPTFMLLIPGQVDAERSISLMRCVRLVKGRWGQTLGVWLLATIITMVLFSVGWLPRLVMNFLTAMGSTPTDTTGLVLAGSVAGVANTLAPAVTYTAITFQYYNLIEQKEQVSLEEDVGRIEQEAAVATTNATDDSPGEGSESTPSGSGGDAPESRSNDNSRWQRDAPDV